MHSFILRVGAKWRKHRYRKGWDWFWVGIFRFVIAGLLTDREIVCSSRMWIQSTYYTYMLRQESGMKCKEERRATACGGSSFLTIEPTECSCTLLACRGMQSFFSHHGIGLGITGARLPTSLRRVYVGPVVRSLFHHHLRPKNTAGRVSRACGPA